MSIAATGQKLRWCAMIALSVAVNAHLGSEVLVAYDGTIKPLRDPESKDYGQVRIVVTDLDLARLDEERGLDWFRGEVIERILADVNPLAVGMA